MPQSLTTVLMGTTIKKSVANNAATKSFLLKTMDNIFQFFIAYALERNGI